MKAVTKDVIKHCPDCAARKGRSLTKEVLASDSRPVVFGGMWHIDGVQLPKSGRYDHLMVAEDAETRYIVLRPSQGESAKTANELAIDIATRFGRPQEITTD